jgi:hypothetical protein
MPIPAFTLNGTLPPYVGPDGPGGTSEDLSPYAVTAMEVVTTLGHTEQRKKILLSWLRHRAALKKIGFHRGFQWLDGSFVEDKNPQDLDVVTFLHRPQGAQDRFELNKLLQKNLHLFGRVEVKSGYMLDFFPIDLDGSAETLVNLTRYWLALFSHRRGDDLWKGMLQVRLEDLSDSTAALAALGPDPAAVASGAGANP